MILTASPIFSQLLARGESFTPLFSSAPSPSVSFTSSSAFTALRSSTGAVFCAADNRPSRFVEESSEEERVDAEKLEEPEAVKYYKLRSIHSVFPFLEDKLPHLDHLLEYSVPYPVHVEVLIRILRYSVKDPSCLHLLRVMLNQNKRGGNERLQLPFSDIGHVQGGASYAMENALSGGFTAVMELALSEKLTNEKPSKLHHVAEKNKRSAPSRYG